MSIVHRERSVGGPSRLGRYELLERLGAGGMAEVWRARTICADGASRIVALKWVLPHLSVIPEVTRMFRAEAELSARLSHPNVVATFEVGEVEGRAYLAMEYVDGIDLGGLLKRGPIPGWLTAYVAHEVCRALEYVHGLRDEGGRALGLVHRDVSPSNIRIGRDGRVRLLDFGIAKALTDTASVRTRTGAIKGKPGYLAPEQLDGAPASQHTDQYALGVVIREALGLGRREEALVSLDAIASRALAPRPADRFPSMAVMGEALDAVVRAQGASASRAASFAEAQLGAPVLVAIGDEPHTQTDVRRPVVEARRPAPWMRLGLLLVALAGALTWGLWPGGEEAATPAAPLVPSAPPVVVAAPAAVPPSPVTGPGLVATPTRAPEAVPPPERAVPPRPAPRRPEGKPSRSEAELRRALDQRFH